MHVTSRVNLNEKSKERTVAYATLSTTINYSEEELLCNNMKSETLV